MIMNRNQVRRINSFSRRCGALNIWMKHSIVGHISRLRKKLEPLPNSTATSAPARCRYYFAADKRQD